MRIGAKGAEEVVAATIGELQVANDQVEGLSAGGVEGGAGVGGEGDAVAGQFDQAAEEGAGIGVVFDEEDVERVGRTHG